ncbi:MAG: hypothetical protein ABJH68_18270 [Ilumatobacter sp.]|uniref:hypothetical protein n=1 Tax=Ilumatobacter sp. TaxID=1967498 RepID=UPI003298F43D
MGARKLIRVLGAVLVVSLSAGCSGSDDDASTSPIAGGEAPDVEAPAFVTAVREAMAAVEDELGGPQRYFEVTSNAQFTNVFVAVDDATATVAYAYVDGELQPPAPKQDGASGNTFAATDVDFVDDRILSGATADLSDSEIDAISVYGDGVGATYVLAASSSAGGFLDIVVGPDGTVFSVDPV